MTMTLKKSGPSSKARGSVAKPREHSGAARSAKKKHFELYRDFRYRIIVDFLRSHWMMLTVLLTRRAEKRISYQKMYATIRRWCGK